MPIKYCLTHKKIYVLIHSFSYIMLWWTHPDWKKIDSKFSLEHIKFSMNTFQINIMPEESTTLPTEATNEQEFSLWLSIKSSLKLSFVLKLNKLFRLQNQKHKITRTIKQLKLKNINLWKIKEIWVSHLLNIFLRILVGPVVNKLLVVYF